MITKDKINITSVVYFHMLYADSNDFMNKCNSGVELGVKHTVSGLRCQKIANLQKLKIVLKCIVIWQKKHMSYWEYNL